MISLPVIPLLAAQPTLLQHILFVAGIALLAMWLLLRARKRLRRGPASLDPREQIERDRQTRGMRGDLEALMVEIEQLAKRLGAQLDAKALRLEKLLEEADARLARLEDRQQQDGPKRTNGSSSARRDPAHGEVAQGDASTPDASDPLAAAVYRLADQGRDAAAIARQLDEHVGKVELILALRAAR